MSTVIHAASPRSLPDAAKLILSTSSDARIFAFRGPMGAGKTTLIKAICDNLGVKDTVTSPTFSIVNEYRSATGEKIFHFDFYRIKELSEAYDMGYEDYFYSGAWCFIEWPEKIETLLPEDVVNVSIREEGHTRLITI